MRPLTTMTYKQKRTIRGLRNTGREVTVLESKGNYCLLLVQDPDEQDVIQRIGLNSRGTKTMTLTYRLET